MALNAGTARQFHSAKGAPPLAPRGSSRENAIVVTLPACRGRLVPRNRSFETKNFRLGQLRANSRMNASPPSRRGKSGPRPRQCPAPARPGRQCNRAC